MKKIHILLAVVFGLAFISLALLAFGVYGMLKDVNLNQTPSTTPTPSVTPMVDEYDLIKVSNLETRMYEIMQEEMPMPICWLELVGTSLNADLNKCQLDYDITRYHQTKMSRVDRNQVYTGVYEIEVVVQVRVGTIYSDDAYIDGPHPLPYDVPSELRVVFWYTPYSDTLKLINWSIVPGQYPPND
jgi:hypothetical protein